MEPHFWQEVPGGLAVEPQRISRTMPATIKALVHLAESAEEADIRDDAKPTLCEATERLPAASATAQ